jgi:hypothetical protein
MSHIPLRRALMAVAALGAAAQVATAQSSDQQSAYVALIILLSPGCRRCRR